MKSSAHLAFHTLCEPTSADAILHGSFCNPESNDVVIVTGSHLVLYTLLTAPDGNGASGDKYDLENNQDSGTEEVKQRFVRHPANDSVRFVSHITLLGAPVAAHLLPDCIFHSYERKCRPSCEAAGSSSCEPSQSSDKEAERSKTATSATHPYDEDPTISSGEIRTTSALLLAFEFGRVVVVGFDRWRNTFVTLSMHVLERRLDPDDDEQYMGLQLRDKIRITTVNDTHVAVCVSTDWSLLSRCRTGNDRIYVYGRRYMVAYCHDERIIHILTLCAEFTRPDGTRKHTYLPFHDYFDGTAQPVDGDNHSVVLVPWLRVESLTDFNVDAKLGFCDHSYFVRGLSFCSDLKTSVLGLLVATKPEAIGTHVAYGDDDRIGGMSFIGVSVYPETRACTILQRVDSLPIDTGIIIGIPPSVYGAAGFLFSSLDFVMWITLLHPTLCWQFTAPTGLLNTCFDDESTRCGKFRFLSAMHLNLDLREYTIDYVGRLFALIPRSRGPMFIGRPIVDCTGVLKDILWCKCGKLDFEVSSSQLLMINNRLEMLASGSGVELASIAVTISNEFLVFSVDSLDESGECGSHDVSITDIPTKVSFSGTQLYRRFCEEVGEGSVHMNCFVPNSGAVRDPRNVALPELWQVGCTRPPKASNSDEYPNSYDPLIQRFKHQRHPYAPIDRQITDLAGVDYVWPRQQSIVGLCDDSGIVILLEKFPVQPVISVPLQSSAMLIPLQYNSSNVPTFDGDHNHLSETRFLLTWSNCTATVTLNEKVLTINHSMVMDRRPCSVASEFVQTPVEAEERTLAYATVCGNRLSVQITPSAAIFIDLLNYKRVCSISLPQFDEVQGSTVKSAEVTDEALLCLFTSGNVVVLSISECKGQPTVSVTHRTTGGVVQLISLYKPNRLNNVFSTTCLTVLTVEGSLLCFELDHFECLFASTGLTQVHSELFNNGSDPLHFVEVSGETSTRSAVDAAVKRRSQNTGTKSRKRSTVSASASRVRKNVTCPEDQTAASTPVDLREGFRVFSSVCGMDEDPSDPVDGLASPSNAMTGLMGSRMLSSMVTPQFEITSTFNRWKRSRKEVTTLEYIVCVRMLDVAPTDEGPTLLVFMTGRPLLVYRSYLLCGKEYVFQLLQHRFIHPLPSAVAVVEEGESPKEAVFMQMRQDRHLETSCISSPVLTLHGHNNLDQSDINHVTVCYPRISSDDVVFYLIGAESKGVTSSSKPLTRSQIESNVGIKKAVDVLLGRLSNLIPTCLRLTAVNNRLRIHEYELENALDTDTIHGLDECRVVSLYSIVTHDESFARYVLFLSQTGTLVLCVPGVLHQDTSINGHVSLQEILAGSDEPDILTSKRVPELTWNPLYCRVALDEPNIIQVELSCCSKRLHAGGLTFSGDFISQMYPLVNFRAKLTAVSHKNYYLSNQVIRANRNATVATLPTNHDIHEVFCGKLVAVVVRYDVNAKEELIGVLNERIKLQLRQLESESLPPGTKPIEIIEPNKQICTLIQTLETIPKEEYASQPAWREMVLVLHMGNLHYWFGEYSVEPMESVLSMTFGIIGNREYLLIGTCTNLGENVESKGDVVVIDLQPLFLRQPTTAKDASDLNLVTVVTKSPTCVTLSQYCKRIFPGAVSFLSSLNTDFDMIFRPNFNFSQDLASIGKSDNVIIYGNEDSRRWTMSHFSPNFSLFVHSVGPRLFVHEVSGKQFVRGAFAEVPLCVSAACVFDKYVVAGDLNMGLHFFMYRHDALNDSRTLCKISSTVKKVDLSVVACAPLVNSDCIGLIISDYFGNIVLFKSSNEDGGRETLFVEAALRTPTRVTHFVRREPEFRRGNQPSAVLGFTAGGGVIHAYMPEVEAFKFFKSVQSSVESVVPPPLAVPRLAFSRPLFTSQMAQTQPVWPKDNTILSLDVLRSLPFQSAQFLDNIATKVSGDTEVSPYQLLNALSGSIHSM